MFGKESEMRFFRQLADKSNFEVVIDGMELHKPLEAEMFENPNYPCAMYLSGRTKNTRLVKL